MVLEGIKASLVASPSDAIPVADRGEVAVTVSADLPEFSRPPSVLVDCRLAKRNIDTRIDQARLVVGLGPGFDAGIDCDAVVETKRGHRLGKVVWDGTAAPDTGVPGHVGGESARRVLRAPGPGPVAWSVDIGDAVVSGVPVGKVGETAVVAPISGVVRGLITPGHIAEEGLKIGDIDPRGERSACFEISDKAMSVGGGVLEAALTRLDRESM
jgi:xanthine dehydrogenase accessory factor